jgi:cytochrome b561
MLRNTPEAYGLVTKCLHWGIALGIIGLLWLGWWMVGLSYYDAWHNRGLALHRALGMMVLGLACLLLLWKLISPSPRLQNELKSWEKLGAHITHGLLLLAMFTIPVTGYVISTSAGKGFSVFDLFEIPALARSSEAVRDLAITAHYTIAYGLIAVIVLHAGAAIKHQIIDKHGTLKRML